MTRTQGRGLSKTSSKAAAADRDDRAVRSMLAYYFSIAAALPGIKVPSDPPQSDAQNTPADGALRPQNQNAHLKPMSPER